jgi:hypothetical protein
MTEAQRVARCAEAFTQQRAAMEGLLEQFDDTVADALRIRAELIGVELEVGSTFLDGAMKARASSSCQRYITNAMRALNAANRFMALKPRFADSAMRDCRDDLRQRLHAVIAEHSL